MALAGDDDGTLSLKELLSIIRGEDPDGIDMDRLIENLKDVLEDGPMTQLTDWDATPLWGALLKDYSRFKGLGIKLNRDPKIPYIDKKAANLYEAIMGEWNTLHTILQYHELTIQKRWSKKTRDQRRKVFLTVWPRMAARHRPDFIAFKTEDAAQREAASRFRSEYLWPEINQEDLLSTPKTFVHFLKARGRHHPGVFSNFDRNWLRLGIEIKALKLVSCELYSMWLTPDRYGMLRHWDDEGGDAIRATIGGPAMSAGEGLLTMERTLGILKFLVSCCKAILPDVLGSDDHVMGTLVCPEPPLSLEPIEYKVLSTINAQVPYGVPADVDLNRVEALLAAKLAAVADHLFALREDPGYFVDRMAIYKEHRHEMMVDQYGKSHPLFKQNCQDILWGRVLVQEIAVAYDCLEVWHNLHQQAAKLVALKEENREHLMSGKPLPQAMATAVLCFENHSVKARRNFVLRLFSKFLGSPNTRRYCIRWATDPGGAIDEKSTIGPGPNFDDCETRAQVLSLLREMIEEGELARLTGFPFLVDELERLLRTNEKALDLISPFVAEQIGDIAVLAECSRQIGNFPFRPPMHRQFRADLVSAERTYKQSTKDWDVVADMMKSWDQKDMLAHGDPRQSQFNYPIDKSRTESNVNQMRLAEDTLDKFWHIFDQKVNTMPRTLGPAVSRFLNEPRTLSRTGPWAPIQRPPIQDLRDDPVQQQKSVSNAYFELEQRTQSKVSAQQAGQSKVKTKTRNLPQRLTEKSEVAEDAAPERHETIFKVDKRAHKVFNALFHQPSASAIPGEIAWRDFLYAMTSIGFSPEKLYGSVWQFNFGNGERGIQFHEPHPSGKIPIHVARRHGRRLSRRFGWHRGLFERLDAPTSHGQ